MMLDKVFNILDYFINKVFDILDYFIKRLFYNTKLRPYEAAIMQAWKNKLPNAAVEKVNRQLELYDLIQRLHKDKAVNFHTLKTGAYKSWPSNVCFPLKSDEFVAAIVIFKGPNCKKKIKAKIIICFGHFVSIEFSIKPKEFLGKYYKKRGDIEIINVKIVVDIMDPDAMATEPLKDASKLKAWLNDWAQEWSLENLRKPLATSERERLLNQLGITMPPDYLELIAQTEGLRVEHCVIYGLTQIWTIVLPDVNFYIVADIEGKGLVGVREDGEDGMLYYYDNEDHIPIESGTSLRAMIEKELQAEQRSMSK